MSYKAKVLALLLACSLNLAGCSRPAADTPAQNEDPSPSQQQEEEAVDEAQQQQTADAEQTQPLEEQSDSTEEQQEEETQEQEEPDSQAEQGDDASAVQGCYKLFDSGYEITAEDPFYLAYDPLMGTMLVQIPDEPAFQCYIYYDTTGQTMDQLESSIKTLEDSYADDPTVTDMKTQVDEQENGLFSMSLSYAAGATEGSPAGYYFIHYQKTQDGLLTANIYSDRSSNAQAIQRLVDTIQPVTENAADFPTVQE